MTFEPEAYDLTEAFPEGRYASTDDFFNARRDWLSVVLIEGKAGGYEIMLRLDGTYSARSDAKRVADFYSHEISSLLAALDPMKLPRGRSA